MTTKGQQNQRCCLSTTASNELKHFSAELKARHEHSINAVEQKCFEHTTHAAFPAQPFGERPEHPQTEMSAAGCVITWHRTVQQFACSVVKILQSKKSCIKNRCLVTSMRFVRTINAEAVPSLLDSACLAKSLGKRSPRKALAQTQFMQWWNDPTIQNKLSSAHRTALPLVKACGAGKASPVRVLDCTGGWGVDAAVLAAAGATVDIVERNPVMAALLTDILQQAHIDSGSLRRLLQGSIGGLWHGDATSILEALTDETPPEIPQVQHLWPVVSPGATPPSLRVPPPAGPWDVVYIDAMFPPRSRASAQVKQAAQWLHAVAAEETIHALPAHSPQRAELHHRLQTDQLGDMGGLLGAAMDALCSAGGPPVPDCAMLRDAPAADRLAAPLVFAALGGPVRRVVVKRPLKSASFELPHAGGGGKPTGVSFTVAGKAVRFDVYLRQWLNHRDS